LLTQEPRTATQLQPGSQLAGIFSGGKWYKLAVVLCTCCCTRETKWL